MIWLPHVYEAALREYGKSDTMPFVLGESQYEGSGKIANDMGEPQVIRRQAYWTMLCGGAGRAYGSDLWGFPGKLAGYHALSGRITDGILPEIFRSDPLVDIAILMLGMRQ